MPHNLAKTNGKIAMMYAGEVPWHRLGTKLDQPATAREAIHAAGLDYLVELKPLETSEGNEVPIRKATVRTDTNEVLGVVGNGYIPVQNFQAFGFLDAVVADGGLRYHTAGALGRGERIWMLAKLPGHIQVKNSADIVDKFFCFLTPTTGRPPFGFTSRRFASCARTRWPWPNAGASGRG
jgi:phage/plasmid-like protein (TIGR03299 family)